jgi:hypothetical protein
MLQSVFAWPERADRKKKEGDEVTEKNEQKRNQGDEHA